MNQSHFAAWNCTRWQEALSSRGLSTAAALRQVTWMRGSRTRGNVGPESTSPAWQQTASLRGPGLPATFVRSRGDHSKDIAASLLRPCARGRFRKGIK